MSAGVLVLGALLFPMQEVSEERLRGHVTELASDAYEGRCVGRPGAERAVAYIVKRLEASGIAALSGGYRQRFTITSSFDSRRKVESTNVVAVIPGNDPRLRFEFVILGAHYDGPGKKGDDNDIVRIGSADRSDQIWNGADDNASGVAVLLEAGRILAAGKLKRSVLLVAFGAEELGNIGSMRFLQALPRSADLEQFTAMVNLHMLGRGRRSVTLLSTATSVGWTPLAEEAARDLVPIRCRKEMAMTGDQASFYDRKIPAVMVFGGFHEFLHTPEDEVEKIDFPLLHLRTRFVVRLVWALANLEERLAWSGPAEAPRVGFDGSDVEDHDAEVLGLSREQGGVRVLDVVPGEAAARAGMKVGDVVLRFGSVTLSRDSSLADLRRAIKESMRKARVPVLVLREGKEIGLEIVWRDR